MSNLSHYKRRAGNFQGALELSNSALGTTRNQRNMTTLIHIDVHAVNL